MMNLARATSKLLYLVVNGFQVVVVVAAAAAANTNLAAFE